MRLSMLLGKTLRQPPSEARLPSHQLLARAGYVRGLEAGLFAYLPLGHLALRRLRKVVRRELALLGGQEVNVPISLEAEPGWTWARLAHREVDSYRQLPVLLFQLTVRTLAQPRARAGLFGASERPFAQVHAFGSTGMKNVEPQVAEALDRIWSACDVQTVWAEAGNGDRRVYFPHESGDEELVRCPECDYATERSWATTAWPDPPEEAESPPEEIETPGCDTIAALAEFLDISAAQTLKMVFYSVEGKVTCAVIRGDRAVDEGKLARALGTDQYYASLEDELAAIGAVGGYASPIGLDQARVRVVADLSVRAGRNFVSGANRPDYHIRNVNIPRDFVPGEWAHLALVEPGDVCPHCSAVLQIEPAFALAQSVAPTPCRPEAEYLDWEGKAHPLWTASWQIDLGRLMAAVVESHHDDYGILWPSVCAPFDVHLVALDLRKEAVAAQAEALYERLQAGGWAVLYDDRSASAGVKFNDADLIGIPLRLTVSKRSVQEDLVEAKWRDSRERLRLDDEGLIKELAQLPEARYAYLRLNPRME
jgi:prolyl-tRNA synthetase